MRKKIYYPTKVINGKQIKIHRYIMEQFLGRKLKNSELVHHINGNTIDNTLNNLQILSRSEYMKIHYNKENAKYQFKRKIFISKKLLKKLYIINNLSMSGVAEKCNVSQPSIFRLLCKYKIVKMKNKCQCGKDGYAKGYCKKCYYQQYYLNNKKNDKK